MRGPTTKQETLSLLMRCPIPDEQLALRARIREEPDYYDQVARVYLSNPFFKLTDDEVAFFGSNPQLSSLSALVASREAAARSTSQKYCVFCMPKSGSSFVQSAIRHALQLPFLPLTTFGSAGAASDYGMNSREQELDELAVIKAVLGAPTGFVAQHHTRYSMHLAWLSRHYGIRALVTVRNILDCIVSFDEMILAWRDGKGANGWLADAQFALPLNYPQLDEDERYAILGRSYGIWLFAFYLSWKRGAGQGIVAPLFVRYESDILDRSRFVELLAGELRMSPEQRERLAAYAESPDPQKSRFNVGRTGRGERVPAATRDLLLQHARAFDEVSAEEVAYLLA